MFFMSLTILTTTMFAQTPVKMLALGDSYTIGESVAAADRWPLQLAKLLEAHQIQCDTPEILAKTGWTTDELSSAIKKHRFQERYDLVTLLIGVNNQYRGRDVEQYRGELRELIQFAIAKAGNEPNRVILLSIPDWGVTPFAKGRDSGKIATEIDAYNAVKKEEAEKASVHFVDITDVTRDIDGDKATLIANDGLHPSSKMYALWAERVLPVALAVLKK
jgi:lysophospholipase L1-like esterase